MPMTDEPMEPVFSELSEAQLYMIEDVLSNDESSSDEELFEFFIEEGIPVVPARAALTYRDRYLANIYLDGHTPIRRGHDAWHYEPQARRFVPD